MPLVLRVNIWWLIESRQPTPLGLSCASTKPFTQFEAPRVLLGHILTEDRRSSRAIGSADSSPTGSIVTVGRHVVPLPSERQASRGLKSGLAAGAMISRFNCDAASGCTNNMHPLRIPPWVMGWRKDGHIVVF